MYSDAIQNALRGTALTFAAVTLVICAVNLWHSGFILSVSAFMAVDFVAFLCVRFYSIISGVSVSSVMDDWGTLLLLHASVTILVLTVYIVTCRRQNGYAFK